MHRSKWFVEQQIMQLIGPLLFSTAAQSTEAAIDFVAISNRDMHGDMVALLQPKPKVPKWLGLLNRAQEGVRV